MVQVLNMPRSVCVHQALRAWLESVSRTPPLSNPTLRPLASTTRRQRHSRQLHTDFQSRPPEYPWSTTDFKEGTNDTPGSSSGVVPWDQPRKEAGKPPKWDASKKNEIVARAKLARFAAAETFGGMKPLIDIYEEENLRKRNRREIRREKKPSLSGANTSPRQKADRKAGILRTNPRAPLLTVRAEDVPFLPDAARKAWAPPVLNRAPSKQREKIGLESWQIQKHALKDKFGSKAWMPAKRLSPDAIAGIRSLNEQEPMRFTTSYLSQQFKVSPEAIRRILKGKWRPTEAEEEDRQARWLKRGESIWEAKAMDGEKPPKKWRERGIKPLSMMQGGSVPFVQDEPAVGPGLANRIV